MPLGPDVRYRMKPMQGGGYERLAFKGNRVVEAKNMSSGKVHTASEFAADQSRAPRKVGLARLTK